MAGTSTAMASAALHHARIIQYQVEVVGQQRVLQLPRDAPPRRHRLGVIEIRVRRTIDEEICSGNDPRRDLHHVELNVRRNDRLDAERAEESLGAAKVLAHAHQVVAHAERLGQHRFAQRDGLVADDDVGWADVHAFLRGRWDASQRIDVGLVAAIHRHDLELALQRRVEIVDVQRYPDDVFLDRVRFLEMRGPRLEVVGISNEHVALAARCPVELDDDRPVDLGAAAKLTRKLQAGPREPLALELSAGLPIEHGLVPEVRDRHLLMLVEREVGDEGTVRHDDDLALLELLDLRHELRVIVQRDDLVDEGEGAVEALGIAVRDRKRTKSLVVSPFENLQRRMGAQRRDGVRPVHGRWYYSLAIEMSRSISRSCTMARSIAGLHRSRSIAAVSSRRLTGTPRASERRHAIAAGPLRATASGSIQTSPGRGAESSSTVRRCLFGLKIVSSDSTRAVSGPSSASSSKNQISLRSTRSTATPSLRSATSAVYAALSGILRLIATVFFIHETAALAPGCGK